MTFKEQKIEQCPECNGVGAFDDIGCCGNPHADGSCCAQGIPTQRVCNCCEGSGWVDVTVIETNNEQ